MRGFTLKKKKEGSEWQLYAAIPAFLWLRACCVGGSGTEKRIGATAAIVLAAHPNSQPLPCMTAYLALHF